MNNRRTIFSWIVVSFIIAVIWFFWSAELPTELSYKAFMEHVDKGDIQTAKIADAIKYQKITGEFSENSGQQGHFSVNLLDDIKNESKQSVVAKLADKNIAVSIALPDWVTILFYPFAFLALVFWGNRRLSFLRSALVASMIVGVLWYWHCQHPLQVPSPGFFSWDALRFKLFDSGPIPFGIFWTFCAGFHYLWLIFITKFMPIFTSDVLDVELIQSAQDLAFSALQKTLQKSNTNGYFGWRILRLVERYQQDRDLSAVLTLKNDILESDEEDFANTFVAVMWCETAMPLLGFLGTVVGVSEAIVAISKGVTAIFNRTAIEVALPNFNKGFEGMGVAFDTTFLGLAGVLVVGLGHFWLKKQFSSKLAEARKLLTNLVSHWRQAESGDAGVQLRLLMTVSGLQERMSNVEHAVRKSDLGATAFRENLQEMAERVVLEDPSLSSIRDILFFPLVEFSYVGESLSDTNFLSEHLGFTRWRFDALGTMLSPANSAIVAVTDDNAGFHFMMTELGIENPPVTIVSSVEQQKYVELIPFDDLNFLARSDQNTNLYLVTLNNPDRSWSDTIVKSDFAAGDTVLRLNIDNRQFGIIIYNSRVVSAWNKESFPKPRDIVELEQGFDWSNFAAYSYSSTLIAAGKSSQDGHWRLTFLTLSEQSKSSTKGSIQQSESLQYNIEFADLPRSLKVKNIIPLRENELLILDMKGNPHYWTPSRSSALALKPQGWKAGPNSQLMAGAQGWIAVVANGLLTMWRVTRGGYLYQYTKIDFRLNTKAIDLDTLTTTSDGQYLVALSADRRKIITWEFPRYAIDNM